MLTPDRKTHRHRTVL